MMGGNINNNHEGEGEESGGSSGGEGGMVPESGGEGGTVPERGGGGGGGGNRWPRQETISLIKIRTDMDVAFRDSSLKAPLWDDVSRKLAELGYHRSAKKCKEKFENVFKYHKRTKDGRSTKSEGKTYRFFEQLEALDSQPPPTPQPRPQNHQTATPATPLSMAMPVTDPSIIISQPFSTTNNSTVLSAQNNLPAFQNPISMPQNAAPIGVHTTSFPSNTSPPQVNPFSISFSAPVPPYKQNPTPVSSSSSTSSDEEDEQRGKRKRKWGDFFQRLTNQVMEKQEEMHKKFLEAMERRERDRVAREEAWRAQEMTRMSREREILAQERAVAAAKDTAVFAFLQKVSASDQQISIPSSTPRSPPPPSEPVRQTPQPVQQTPQPVQQNPQPQASLQKPVSPLPPSLPIPPLANFHLQIQPLAQSTRNEPNIDNGGEIVNFKYPNPSSSRWPKAEIEALIKLRTNLDVKYQENVPKGPLWEDISAAMLRLGYNRNAKRCKEKWENINKYYKKVKESNKKRPEDSKTCPYFSQLDAIYKDRVKSESLFKQESLGTPIMAQPEQQWPAQDRPELLLMEGQDSDEGIEDDDDEEDESGNYELVANKPSPVGTVE